uniref:Odorant-binding protein 1 n=2 Tax=Adelphocoris TaxID=236345 RepID=F4Y5P0_ADELI|nr:odorant-binding protein 1 [Adelphocoris lineolatus]ANA10227.1 odorant-binding protein 1 [Adelphocoris suturalis]
MNSLIPVLLVVCAAATRADEQTNAMVAKAFNKCREEFPISDDEIGGVREKTTIPESHNAKCLMACMLREGKMLRDGKYEKENALIMADVLNKDDPASADKAKQLVETCAGKVGTDAGGDECEFAYKMAVCAAEEAKKLGVRPPDF